MALMRRWVASANAVRTVLSDGDTITLRGHAEGDGTRVGFGAVSGTVCPAPPLPSKRCQRTIR